MTENTVYWVWLQMVMGIGARVEDLLSVFPTARSLYESSDMERRLSGVFTPKQLDKLERIKLSAAMECIRRCQAMHHKICTPEDPLYPNALRNLSDMPLVLYVRGNLDCLLEKLAIAIVGSRSASLYSVDVTQCLARDLAHAGTVVVSGCALGVDSAAHIGAIYAKGKTIAVLGCGLNTPYLIQNEALREEIVRNGALITEYPPDTPARPGNFPMRNRIISGLCSGTLVVEAGEKSGSLITARFAAEQGRDVFGVPGDLTSMNYMGVNRLIRDGAKPVFSARDILSEYMWLYDEDSLSALSNRPLRSEKQIRIPRPDKSTAKSSSDKSADASQSAKTQHYVSDSLLSETARTIYTHFSDTPLYTDDLVRATGFAPNCVFTALTELEICGFIKMIEGKRYVRVSHE